MKLEALFTVKNNELYFIQAQNQQDNSKINLDKADLPEITADKLTFLNKPFCKITIPWSKIEIEEELYNEVFLADLRDFLKTLDDKNQFAIISPLVDKEMTTLEQMELFTNAFNHTARRIKDCISVAGMELPKDLLKDGFNADSPCQIFMEVLAKKHEQYVYFANKASCLDLGVNVPEEIVLL